MNLTNHCKVCDNSDFNLKTGTICGLTNDKPDFKSTCSKIDFNKKIEEEIIQVNEEYELVKSKKSLSYANFYVFLSLGIIVMFADYILSQFIFDKGFVSTISLFIFFVGVSFIPLSFGPLNKFKQNMGVATEKKNTLDAVLALYNISYDISTTISKDVHGIESCKSTLEVKLPPEFEYQP